MKHKPSFSTPRLALLLFLAPSPAMANVILPSVIDAICAPLPNSDPYFLPISVASWLTISTIEAVAANSLSKLRRFWRLWICLLIANLFSSFCGIAATLHPVGSIYPSWWAFPVAYVLSAVVESPFIWLALRRGCKFLSALRFSFAANAVSYALLLFVVLGLTAIPMRLTDPTKLRAELKGQVFVYHYKHSLSLVDKLSSGSIKRIATGREPYTHGFHGSSTGRMFLVDGQLRAWEVTRAGKSWSVASEPTPLPGRLLAVGADGETLVCGSTNQIILVSKQGVMRTISIEEGAPIRAALSHDRRYLAYTAMDPGWFASEARNEFGWEAKGTRGTMPPQFLQDYGELRLLDLSTGTFSGLTPLTGNCIGFHPATNLLAIGETPFGMVSIMNVETRSTERVWTKKFGRVISEFAWSPDGKYLAFLQWHGPHRYVHRGYDASLWVITPDGKRSAPLPVAFAGSQLGLWNVAWRND